jgi:hypothetical protein
MGNSACTICEDAAALNGKRKLDQVSSQKNDEGSKIRNIE